MISCARQAEWKEAERRQNLPRRPHSRIRGRRERKRNDGRNKRAKRDKDGKRRGWRETKSKKKKKNSGGEDREVTSLSLSHSHSPTARVAVAATSSPPRGADGRGGREEAHTGVTRRRFPHAFRRTPCGRVAWCRKFARQGNGAWIAGCVCLKFLSFPRRLR